MGRVRETARRVAGRGVAWVALTVRPLRAAVLLLLAVARGDLPLLTVVREADLRVLRALSPRMRLARVPRAPSLRARLLRALSPRVRLARAPRRVRALAALRLASPAICSSIRAVVAAIASWFPASSWRARIWRRVLVLRSSS